MQIEEWRDIAGYEDRYQVSNFGRVRSLRMVNNRTNKIRREPKIMALNTRGGRPESHLSFCLRKDGKQSRRFVHSLVLIAFVGPRPDGYECAHLDGNAQNNHISNLKWVTKKENESHKVLHGTAPRGENAHQSRLKEVDIRFIRSEASKGVPEIRLAEKFGVTFQHINDVVKGKKWKHVK